MLLLAAQQEHDPLLAAALRLARRALDALAGRAGPDMLDASFGGSASASEGRLRAVARGFDKLSPNGLCPSPFSSRPP
jgi:hypothetical protein